MGVLMSASTLKTLAPCSGWGLRGNSDGRTGPGDVGVFKSGRLGLAGAAGAGITAGEARAMVCKRLLKVKRLTSRLYRRAAKVSRSSEEKEK